MNIIVMIFLLMGIQAHNAIAMEDNRPTIFDLKEKTVDGVITYRFEMCCDEMIICIMPSYLEYFHGEVCGYRAFLCFGDDAHSMNLIDKNYMEHMIEDEDSMKK